MDEYLKPIPDSPDPEEHFNVHGFYLYGGKYYTFEIQRKNKIEVELSNFVGKSLYHLVNGTNNSKRLIQLQRNTGETHIVEVQSSEMKLDSFETILKTHQCTFYGNTYNQKRIFAQWMDHEIQANIIGTLGYSQEHDIYALSNAVVTPKGDILDINEIGIVDNPDHEKNKFYLPAFSKAHINNHDYDGDRKFRFIEGELNFQQWSELYFTAFETNGGIAILFLILALFRDIVFSQVGFFPFLFLFGAYGTGKTTMVEYLLRVFGDDFIGTPLNKSTQVALSRIIASRNNAIFYLKEYTKETDDNNQDLFLTAYDGSGRATGIKSNDNRTKVNQVKSAMILDGNELPTQKTAVLSRMILLNFEKNTFTQQQRIAHGKMEKIQDQGFGKVLVDILKLRDYFQQGFKKTFRENLDELREVIPSDFAERTVKHIALLLTPAKLLYDKLQFPFSFNEITGAVVDNAIEQNRLLKQTDEMTIFWQAFEWGISSGNIQEFNEELGNKKTAGFNVKLNEAGEDILQVKLQKIIPEYVRYCRNNNLRSLDFSSIRMLLTSKSNPDFLPTSQKGRGLNHTDFKFGTCYQFRLNSVGGDYVIGGVEINF